MMRSWTVTPEQLVQSPLQTRQTQPKGTRVSKRPKQHKATIRKGGETHLMAMDWFCPSTSSMAL